MVNALEEVDVSCPYCGAPFTMLLDVSQGPCDYIEDCAVCCAPIEVMLRFGANAAPELWLRRGDDAG
jgi:hypothetical protein